MIKKILIVLLFILLSNISYSSGIVMDFSDDMKDICIKNNSTLLSKKIFLTILRLERDGKYPCDDIRMRALVSNCVGMNHCTQVVSVYRNIIARFEGRVVGQ